MGSDSGQDLSVGDPTLATLGGYNNLVQSQPGFSYGNPPSDAYLQSLYDTGNQPSYLTPQNPINPYTGQAYDVSAAAPYNGGSGLSLSKILGGLGGLATALGPALGAAGQLAMNALNQRPFFRPTPYINAPGARTEGGVTKPLSLGGQVVTNDPLANYVKLIQGMR